MSMNDQPTAQMEKTAFVMTWIVAGAVTFGLMEGVLWSSFELLSVCCAPPLAAVIGGSVGGLIQWSVLRKWIPRCGEWIPASAAGVLTGLIVATTWFTLIDILSEGMGWWAFHFPESEWGPGFPAFAMIAAFHLPEIVWGPDLTALAMFEASTVVIGAIAGGVGGLVGGLLQSPILRRSVPESSQWIGISMLGWAVVGAVAGLGFEMSSNLPLEFYAALEPYAGGNTGAIIICVINTIAGVLGGAASGAIGGQYLARLLPAAAARAPGWTRDAHAVRGLLDALRDTDVEVRGAAAGVLEKFEDDVGVPALIDALRDADARVRLAAVVALEKIGADAVPGLLDALRDAEVDVRWRAAGALKEIGAAAVPGLLDALRDADAEVRWEAAGALGGIGDAAAVPALIDTLRDDADAKVRRYAARALERIDTPEALAAVEEWRKQRGKAMPAPDIFTPISKQRITAVLARVFLVLLVLLGLGAVVLFLPGIVDELSRGSAFRHFEPALNAEECSAALLPDAACTGVRVNEDWTPIIREFDGVPMALVPAGCFKMGSDRAADGMDRAAPVHEVCLTQPFWIDVYEVTNEQVGHSGDCGKFPATSADREPHDCISWVEAYHHCQERGARLPTEAEWEYAARGPDGLDYPWGDGFREEFEPHLDRDRAVGTRWYDVSWVGAYDFEGLVMEMTNDRWRPYERGFQTDPSYPYLPGVDDTSAPVVKGVAGCAVASRSLCCPAARGRSPIDPMPKYGFRCARSWYPVVSE